jgi:hypothetical protein
MDNFGEFIEENLIANFRNEGKTYPHKLISNPQVFHRIKKTLWIKSG